MSREATYLSLILKKQPYGEGDELVTVFTKENGKHRFLGKSTKLAKSKLQHGLQVLFLTELSVAGNKLPKITGTQVKQTFSNIRENLRAAKIAFFVLELLLKFLPDEQKNEPLFLLAVEFFGFLDEPGREDGILDLGLTKFKIAFLEAVGFGIQGGRQTSVADKILFSNHSGGFLFNETASDAQRVSANIYQQFLDLSGADFNSLEKIGTHQEISELQSLLSGFLLYHLQRDLKSEKFLNGL